MTHARFPSEIAQRILTLLETNKTSFGEFATVFYGDQDKLPTTPTICIEAGVMERSLASAQGPAGRTLNECTCYIIVYYAKVDSNQVTKLAGETTSEAVAAFLDTNPQLLLAGIDPKVIHGFVRVIDHGYIRKDTLMYGSRLTWVGKTKMQLGV
jgi:hypothetical protein